MSNIATTVITGLVAVMKKAGSIITNGHQTEAEAALTSLLTKAIEGNVDTYALDGAIALTSRVAKLTKGSAGAYTLAAPDHDGQQISIVGGTAFAHVITATGLLNDGVTGGAKNTITLGAFVGASATLVGLDGKWSVLAVKVATIA